MANRVPMVMSDAGFPERMQTGDVLVDAAGNPIGGGGASTWTDGPAFTRVTSATFAVADNTENQAIFAAGRPVRIRPTGGTWKYAVVTGYASGTVTIAGCLPGSSEDDEIQYADFLRYQIVEVNVPGKFSAAASNTLIASFAKWFAQWGGSRAYIVRFRHKVTMDDSGANQPRVNVRANGQNVASDNSGAGLPISDAAWVKAPGAGGGTTIDRNQTGSGSFAAAEITGRKNVFAADANISQFTPMGGTAPYTATVGIIGTNGLVRHVFTAPNTGQTVDIDVAAGEGIAVSGYARSGGALQAGESGHYSAGNVVVGTNCSSASSYCPLFTCQVLLSANSMQQSAYALTFDNSDIEVTVDANGSNKDAENLTVHIGVVIE